MAYRGLGNQRLGASADLAQVLDTLMKIDSEERKSDERIAMENIRQDMATKRQSDRDDKLFQQNIDLRNRETKHMYDAGDLVKDDVGLLFPSEGSITRSEKSELETKLQGITGGEVVDFDTPQYGNLMESVNKGATWYENVQWDKDPYDQYLTYHDIPEIIDKIGRPEGVDVAQFEAAVRSGARANKGILQSDKEIQDLLYSKSRADLYRTTGKTDLSEKQMEQFLRDDVYIKEYFYERLYKKVFKPTDLGVEVTAPFDRKLDAVHKKMQAKAKNMGVGQIEDTKRAINEIFGLEWEGRESTRDFLTNFKKWDKEGRTGGRSVAENLFMMFDLENQYNDLHSLTSQYKDPQGQIKKEEEVQRHFRYGVKQVTPTDEWDALIGGEGMFFLDELVQEDSASFSKDGNTLVVKIKDFKRLEEVMNTLSQSSNQRQRDAADKIWQLRYEKRLRFEDF